MASGDPCESGAFALSISSVIAGFGAFEAVYVFERFAEPALTAVTSHQDRRDWIDAAVPSGSSVALVPSPLESSVQWWNAEYWNKRSSACCASTPGSTFTPFPVDDVFGGLRDRRACGGEAERLPCGDPQGDSFPPRGGRRAHC